VFQQCQKLPQPLQRARQANGVLKEDDCIERALIDRKDVSLVNLVQAPVLHQLDEGLFDVDGDDVESGFAEQQAVSPRPCSSIQNAAST